MRRKRRQDEAGSTPVSARGSAPHHPRTSDARQRDAADGEDEGSVRATPVAPLLLIVVEIDTGALLQRARGQGAGMIRLVERGNQPIDGRVVLAARERHDRRPSKRFVTVAQKRRERFHPSWVAELRQRARASVCSRAS